MKIAGNLRTAGVCLTILTVMLAATIAPAFADIPLRSYGNSHFPIPGAPQANDTQPGELPLNLSPGELPLNLSPGERPINMSTGRPGRAPAAPPNGEIQNGTAQVNCNVSLTVRYAVAEARVNLMIAVMEDVVKLVPQASDLNIHITTLKTDLGTLNTYVASNDTAGFNLYVKTTLHPDMLNASKALVKDNKMFKEWGVSKDTIKQLKKDTKEFRDEYNVGDSVSAVAGNDASSQTQAYLNKAGIQFHGNPGHGKGLTVQAHGGGSTSVNGTAAGNAGLDVQVTLNAGQ